MTATLGTLQSVQAGPFQTASLHDYGLAARTRLPTFNDTSDQSKWKLLLTKACGVTQLCTYHSTGKVFESCTFLRLLPPNGANWSDMLLLRHMHS